MRIVITDFLDEKKITAIKAVREITGYGLREAKEVIDTVRTGVPQLLENQSAVDLVKLRKAGIYCHSDYSNQPRLPLDKIQIMRDLVNTLMEEGQFKSAQCIIDAMEVLDE